ncbi:beta-lactamase family protein [Nesterenkonia sp. MY13]|uniref:Beta-lactamase family protein n=1 Tax=Nesterenkonia sedimenti TaxID=1463632 RepID=A0A7X8YD52_9MICC|nr:serine hydrolase domain-containing protein [Nesterenkonia sedimenti]NLS09308.1 beta-lactamase family protein [Nesterenkonia sedimenti]
MSFDPMPTLRSIAPYLSDWASFQAEYRGVVGFQLAVARGDELLVNHAWGEANAETGEKLTTDHLFRIASHSKTMTSVLVFRLVERGALRLDDTIGQHITELAESPVAPVTIRELLGHQGGIIRDSSDGDFWQRHHDFLDREEVIDVARREAVVFEPNLHFKYTNIGYSLLGLILESAGGASYQQLCEEHLVQPLGLTHSGAEYDPERAEEYAAGHTGLITPTDPRRVVPHVDTRGMAAATGWYSTAADLTRYGAAHVMGNESLISDASKRLMQRQESTIAVRGREVGRYGLGLALDKVGDRELVGHSGGYPGHITITFIDPKDGLVVSVLTNAVDGPAGALARGVIQLIDLAIKAAQEEPELVPEDLRFSGRFAYLWGVFDVTDLGGILHMINPRLPDPAQASSRIQVKDGRLIHEEVPGFANPGEPVRVTRDDAGQIRSVRFGAQSTWPIENYRAYRDERTLSE